MRLYICWHGLVFPGAFSLLSFLGFYVSFRTLDAISRYLKLYFVCCLEICEDLGVIIDTQLRISSWCNAMKKEGGAYQVSTWR